MPGFPDSLINLEGEAVRFKPERKYVGPEEYGIADFLTLQMEIDTNWGIVAVKASVDEVTRALDGWMHVERWEKDVRNRRVRTSPDFIYVLRFKHHDWTLVISTLSQLGEDDPCSRNDRELALQLSEACATRTVAFHGQDDFCTMGYQINERGECLESSIWEISGGLLQFQSRIRATPSQICDVFTGRIFMDRVFKMEGVYIPPFYLDGDGFHEELATEGFTREDLERVDFLAISQGLAVTA